MQDDKSNSEKTTDSSDFSEKKNEKRFRVARKRRKAVEKEKSSTSSSNSDENENEVIDLVAVEKTESPEETRVPADPREWDAEDIAAWLRWCAKEFNIEHLQKERFPTTGKEICEMSQADFWVCASGYGGKTMAKYIAFQLQACGIDRKDLIDDNDPSEYTLHCVRKC